MLTQIRELDLLIRRNQINTYNNIYFTRCLKIFKVKDDQIQSDVIPLTHDSQVLQVDQ